MPGLRCLLIDTPLVVSRTDLGPGLWFARVTGEVRPAVFVATQQPNAAFDEAVRPGVLPALGAGGHVTRSPLNRQRFRVAA